jgi:hypothetical protein
MSGFDSEFWFSLKRLVGTKRVGQRNVGTGFGFNPAQNVGDHFGWSQIRADCATEFTGNFGSSASDPFAVPKRAKM